MSLKRVHEMILMGQTRRISNHKIARICVNPKTPENVLIKIMDTCPGFARDIAQNPALSEFLAVELSSHQEAHMSLACNLCVSEEIIRQIFLLDVDHYWVSIGVIHRKALVSDDIWHLLAEKKELLVRLALEKGHMSPSARMALSLQKGVV